MPGRCSVVICYNSIVLPSGSLAVMSFGIMTGAIVYVGFLARCMFAPESEIYIICLLGELDGVLILLITISLGVLILVY